MTAALQPTVDVRRSRERYKTQLSWLDSKHSFSFSHHYDPQNTHHGLLLVNNDDIVTAGTGFETHPHQDMEIVTWVLQGSLVHQDSTGHAGLIYPGLAQRDHPVEGAPLRACSLTSNRPAVEAVSRVT